MIYLRQNAKIDTVKYLESNWSTYSSSSIRRPHALTKTNEEEEGKKKKKVKNLEQVSISTCIFFVVFSENGDWSMIYMYIYIYYI